jgi:hypothetical protein
MILGNRNEKEQSSSKKQRSRQDRFGEAHFSRQW